MPSTTFDVVSIGNAIVDVLCRCEDVTLTRMGLAKGAMRYVNSALEFDGLLRHFPRRTEIAGGSACNTAVGIASFGGHAAFVGKVANDPFGRIFRHDLHGTGVDFRSRGIGANSETSRSLILITPDGARTMLTLLSTGSSLTADTIDASLVTAARCIFVEGYLIESPSSRAAAHFAVSLAARAGGLPVLALSDPQCVSKNRTHFEHLLRAGVGLLIANEAEIRALYGTAILDKALRSVAGDVRHAIVTRGAQGCIIVGDGAMTAIPAERVPRVIDATGAGDMFAAGVLYGLSRRLAYDGAARLGCFAASKIISQVGARPERPLAHAARLRGLMSKPTEKAC